MKRNDTATRQRTAPLVEIAEPAARYYQRLAFAVEKRNATRAKRKQVTLPKFSWSQNNA